MNLQYYNFECENCGKKFKSPELLGNPYGEFLMRSKKGDIAYLYALNSKVFKEFGDILDQHQLIFGMKKIEQARVLHRIFGLACDISSDGTCYEIAQKPTCPFCGKSQIKYWGPTNPPELINEKIKQVAHENWNNLTNKEKKCEIDKAVTDYLKKII